MRSVESNLFAYAVRRRAVVLLSAIVWSALLWVAWLAVWGLVDRALGLSVTFRIVVLAIGVVGGGISLFAWPIKIWRQNALDFAMEIERAWPEFDQRLLTVVSEQAGSALVGQLREQVEVVFSRRPSKIRVSTAPLLVGGVFLAVVLAVVFSSRGERRCFKRLYSPLSVSSKMNSTSTLASSGSVLTPTAARACFPASPNSCRSSSLAPLATWGC